MPDHAHSRSPPHDVGPAAPFPPATPDPSLGRALLSTKLFIPQPRGGLVDRPRLLARLDALTGHRLTLVAAPPGSGKTALLGAWCAGPIGREIPVAWLSLDAGDNDPARFWRYVVAALDTVHPGCADTLGLLRSPEGPPIEAMLTLLLNALVVLRRDSVLVLDDYHAIETPAIHRAMAFLLDHLPPRLHLVIASRADPPLPLAHLRARDDLLEVRAADLRFTADEAAAFLTQTMHLGLSAEQVAVLAERTEGWIAGLQLAALSLQGQPAERSARLIAAFAGSNRYIVDYLVEEVLARQPPAMQAFLLETSILDRLSGPLCDHLTEREDGQATLEALERANLFVTPFDDERGWYRYHRLFADVLRQRLHRKDPASVRVLHRRAGAWFAQRGLAVEAMPHAMAGEDWPRAAALVERHALSVVVDGQVRTVLAWLDALPDALVRTRPTLCLIHAFARMVTNQPEAAEARLRDAECAVGAGMPADEARITLGWVATLRANIARFSGDLARCVSLAREALDLLPASEAGLRAVALLNASRNYLLSGDVTPATERRLTTVLSLMRGAAAPYAHLSGLTTLARMQLLQGRLHTAAATYATAVRVVPGADELRALIGAPTYYFGLGELLRERGDLDGAEACLAQGMALVGGTLTVDAEYVALGAIALARVRRARGDDRGAIAALDAFAAVAERRQFFAPLLDRVAAARAHLLLAGGELAEGVRWADASGLRAEDEPPYPREAEHLTLARVRIAQGRGGPAGEPLSPVLGLLDRLLAAAEAGGRMASAIEILILRALALDARGDGEGADAALERALSLAAPEGFLRIFIDEGPPLAAVLRRTVADRWGRPGATTSEAVRAYASHLLAAFAASVPATATTTAATSLAEALTAREREVLALIAAGLSNAEIAARLFVGVGTIKTHVNRLLAKLGATSRTQAAARARALGLLTE